MAFGNETAGWIHDPLAAISDVAFHHKLPGLALRAQAKAFVSDEFVGGEAVVQLDHLNVMRFDARHGIGGSGCALGHTRANHLHHAAFKSGFGVRTPPFHSCSTHLTPTAGGTTTTIPFW